MGTLIRQGRTKELYETEDARRVALRFKDDVTAFNGMRTGVIPGKGAVNCAVSARLFSVLEAAGVPTQQCRQIGDTECSVLRAEVIPVECVVRNIAAGSICRRLPLREGEKLEKPVLELGFKHATLDHAMINRTHIEALSLATEEEVQQIFEISRKTNEVLGEFLKARGVTLADFRLEFGRIDGHVAIIDEISPDTCRFWDTQTGDKLDKDRFRQEMDDVEGAYQAIYARICKAS